MQVVKTLYQRKQIRATKRQNSVGLLKDRCFNIRYLSDVLCDFVVALLFFKFR